MLKTIKYIRSNNYFSRIADTTAAVEVFNPRTKQWRPINMMNKVRVQHAMHVVNDKLTVYGGDREAISAISIEELNDDGKSWSLMDSTLIHDFADGVSVVVPSTKPN